MTVTGHRTKLQPRMVGASIVDFLDIFCWFPLWILNVIKVHGGTRDVQLSACLLRFV